MVAWEGATEGVLRGVDTGDAWVIAVPDCDVNPCSTETTGPSNSLYMCSAYCSTTSLDTSKLTEKPTVVCFWFSV